MDILKNKNLKQSKFTVNIYCGGGGWNTEKPKHSQT